MAAEGCSTVLSLGLRHGDKRSKDDNKKHAAASRDNGIDLSLIITLGRKDDEDAGGLDHKSMGDGKFVHKSYELNIGSRKKLRLTKEQSSLREDSFKLHNTLNSSQKQALAEQLNLKPRQVEVWFQNRRARTKLKQTEVDYEFLKKCHESLTKENKRLKKELQSIKAEASPLFQKATTCPSCNKIN